MTGTIDYLSDGKRVIAVENGHEFLGQVTGVCHPPTVPNSHNPITNRNRPAAPSEPYLAAS